MCIYVFVWTTVNYAELEMGDAKFIGGGSYGDVRIHL